MLPTEVPLSIDRSELVGFGRLGDERLTLSILDIAICITLDTFASVDVTEFATFTKTEASLTDIR